MKRPVIILLIVAVAVAVYYLYPRWFEKPVNPNEIKLSGNIEAHESLVSFKVTGRVVELPIEEGQAVQADQLLAKLDDADYRQQVSVDEANAPVRADRQVLGRVPARFGRGKMPGGLNQLEVADLETSLQRTSRDATGQLLLRSH